MTPILERLRAKDDAGEYEGTLVNPDGPEAADFIEELVQILRDHPEYAADTTFAAIWQWLARKDAALSKLKGPSA